MSDAPYDGSAQTTVLLETLQTAFSTARVVWPTSDVPNDGRVAGPGARHSRHRRRGVAVNVNLLEADPVNLWIQGPRRRPCPFLDERGRDRLRLSPIESHQALPLSLKTTWGLVLVLLFDIAHCTQLHVCCLTTSRVLPSYTHLFAVLVAPLVQRRKLGLELARCNIYRTPRLGEPRHLGLAWAKQTHACEIQSRGLVD
jgi:hypothetical protein